MNTFLAPDLRMVYGWNLPREHTSMTMVAVVPRIMESSTRRMFSPSNATYGIRRGASTYADGAVLDLHGFNSRDLTGHQEGTGNVTVLGDAFTVRDLEGVRQLGMGREREEIQPQPCVWRSQEWAWCGWWHRQGTRGGGRGPSSYALLTFIVDVGVADALGEFTTHGLTSVIDGDTVNDAVGEGVEGISTDQPPRRTPYS